MATVGRLWQACVATAQPSIDGRRSNPSSNGCVPTPSPVSPSGLTASHQRYLQTCYSPRREGTIQVWLPGHASIRAWQRRGPHRQAPGRAAGGMHPASCSTLGKRQISTPPLSRPLLMQAGMRPGAGRSLQALLERGPRHVSHPGPRPHPHPVWSASASLIARWSHKQSPWAAACWQRPLCCCWAHLPAAKTRPGAIGRPLGAAGAGCRRG